jgi:asparagine synthase (glutamine-hydrolysing)
MCGIVGIVDSGRPAVEREGLVRRMMATIAHRGPDASGAFVDATVAIGHCRLSILDLSPTGAQPMSLGTRAPVITFNGEIYNFAELRRELVSEGRVFRGSSDTEVILHAYALWGFEGLKRLEGIFAFGLWDPVAERLVLMRDRLGVKPLFYAASGETIAFASEIKAILAAGGADTAIDEQAFSEYLWYGNAYEERTIYRGVSSLLPGHWMVVEKGKRDVAAWWRIEEWSDAPRFAGSRADAEAAVQEALDAAVRRQLVADVPVSLFLSGGIDSSAIAVSAMRVQERPLKAYTACFDGDDSAGDVVRARQVAAHLKLEHHQLEIHGRDLATLLPELVCSHDEPFGDAANIPLYMMARAFSGTGKVVLQGDGGDEMFAGYRQYSILQRANYVRLLPRSLFSLSRPEASDAWSRLARVARAMKAPTAAMRMALLLTIETLERPPTALLADDARAHLERATDPFLGYRHNAARFARHEPLQQMLLTDLMLQLPSQFLPKVDRATMAAGVEARVPLLDEKVARLALSLPMQWKVHGGTRKVILRNVLRKSLPHSILGAPKSGFGVPYRQWLATSLFEFARSAVLEPRFIRRFGFDQQRLESAFAALRRDHRRGGFTLWKVLQLALWADQHPVAA